ncbi:MAG TPA: hypothetical protein ENN67_01635 [Firmicutes bacterium]|nr:hypothetical protein [Bacillota bacterium]
MTDETVQSLALELNVGEDIAQSALERAGGELMKAREILLDLLPGFFIIKIKYIVSRADSDCGMILICVERDNPEYIISRALIETNIEWLDGINIHGSLGTLIMIFNENKLNPRTASAVQDARELVEKLKSMLMPSDFYEFFNYWKLPKADLIDENQPDDNNEENYNSESVLIENEDDAEYNFIITHDNFDVRDALTEMFRVILEEIFYKRIEVLDVDYEFMTSAQYDEAMENLGYKPPTRPKSTESEAGEEKEPFKLYLKGRMLIDPTGGTPVENLDIGHIVYCDILDRSEVAQSAAQMIGAYKRGLWLPVRGTISEIEKIEGERWRLRIKLASGIYIDTIAFSNLRIRQHGLTSLATARKVYNASPSINPTTLFAGILLVVAMIIIFITMRGGF